jgi:hypothetical protein
MGILEFHYLTEWIISESNLGLFLLWYTGISVHWYTNVSSASFALNFFK